ncbi:hypothetical protein HL658_05855 [Azospirillum sp. RWY-5-1]|uniref:Uncharacterized protein n=1 Tax=Azospirillum oleiclasticum TaxID=2735135 RepID=A0ABX2T4N4_9PROT|nr:hypothetical protein [Azospirillum oleiclasticum]NYZ12068.1 hypothetical protein [Azospirillum oleiclasticum]NYZ19228.1 hypothetical protein [Azospirillum oleiclasticum]
MLHFANVTVARLSPEQMQSIQRVASMAEVNRPAAASSAYRQTATAPDAGAPRRATDTVSVTPLLLDMDRDHLAAFSALGEKTRNRLIELHNEGTITTHTVESALDLALTDVRQRRYTEDRQATLTDDEKAELVAIDKRRNEPRLRTWEETYADMVREREIQLNIKVPDAVKATGGLPMPLGHPGVQVATGSDMIENQKLRDLGVNIGREPGFEQRLMEKLRAGEIAQVGRVD